MNLVSRSEQEEENRTYTLRGGNGIKKALGYGVSLTERDAYSRYKCLHRTEANKAQRDEAGETDMRCITNGLTGLLSLS